MKKKKMKMNNFFFFLMSFSAKQLYHWKEHEKLVKKGVSFFTFRCMVLEIMRSENCKNCKFGGKTAE